MYYGELRMKKNIKGKKIYKKLFFVVILVYLVYLFISQQKTLNAYKASQKFYTKKLDEQLAYHESLVSTKENINSIDYIEEIAREKLDMYLPNETVYVDKSK